MLLWRQSAGKQREFERGNYYVQPRDRFNRRCRNPTRSVNVFSGHSDGLTYVAQWICIARWADWRDKWDGKRIEEGGRAVLTQFLSKWSIQHRSCTVRRSHLFILKGSRVVYPPRLDKYYSVYPFAGHGASSQYYFRSVTLHLLPLIVIIIYQNFPPPSANCVRKRWSCVCCNIVVYYRSSHFYQYHEIRWIPKIGFDPPSCFVRE